MDAVTLVRLYTGRAVDEAAYELTGQRWRGWICPGERLDLSG
ncbi:hypothetical protein ABT075_40070 [Streptomyces sp. NPDC002677]